MKTDQEFIQGIYKKASVCIELGQLKKTPLQKFKDFLLMHRMAAILTPCLCLVLVFGIVLTKKETKVNLESYAARVENETDFVEARAAAEPAAFSFSSEQQLSADRLDQMKQLSSAIVEGTVCAMMFEEEECIVTLDIKECFLGSETGQISIRYNTKAMLMPESDLPYEFFFDIGEQVLVFLKENQTVLHSKEFLLNDFGRDGKFTYVGEESGDSIYKAADGNKLELSRLREFLKE